VKPSARGTRATTSEPDWHVFDRLASHRGHVAVGEALRKACGLWRRDQRDALDARVRKLADEVGEPAGVARRSAPSEPNGVRTGTHARAAVFGREPFDLRAGHVRRREHRDRQALCGELVAPLLGLRLERVVSEVELDRVLEDDGRAAAEVIEEGRAGAESRRERVCARRVPTLAERIDERRVRREVRALVVIGVREPIPPRAGELVRDRGRAFERELARRKNDQLLERRLRALRHRVEGAKRLDLIAEELDASGLFGRRGVDVDDPATPRERARLAHLGHGLVAEIEEPRGGLGPGEPIARAKRSAATRELLGRDGVLEQGAQARDDGDRDGCGREPPEREETLMDRGAGRSARFERHRLALREREHAVVAKPSGELRPPAARPVFTRRDEGDGARVPRDERGPCERPRSRGRIGDGDALSILQSRRELAEGNASVGELEDASESRARDVDRANH